MSNPNNSQDVTYANDPYECIENADAAVIVD